MGKEITPIILRNWLNVQGQNNAPVDVGGLGVGYTMSLPLTQESSFGLLLQFASPGAIEVQVDFEQSNVRPAIEQAASLDFVIPQNSLPLFESVTDGLIHIVAFNPVVTKYARLLLTGSGVNDPGTQLTRAELTYVRI